MTHRFLSVPLLSAIFCFLLHTFLFTISRAASSLSPTPPNLTPQQTEENPCIASPDQCQSISIVATVALRGSLWPSIDKNNPPEDNDCYDQPIDKEGCIGGCLRRVAYIRHLQSTEKVLTVDTGGIYFGNGEVAFTMFGSKPYEICTRETRYDLVSLGGSDMYMGLDVLRDFFSTVGRKANALNSLQLHVLSNSQQWANGMESASFMHHNGQSPVIDQDHGGGLVDGKRKKGKSQILNENRLHPRDNDLNGNHARAQEQLELFAVVDYDFVREVQQEKQQQSTHFKTTQQSNAFITRPHIISTNLRANNDKWKLFLQPSALLQIAGTNFQVAFVSILPNFYNDSLTNPPSWFRISPDYSQFNHIRAEVTRLRRLDVNKRIKAIVLLIQEVNPQEILHIEHINAFIIPRGGLQDSIQSHTNIYGNRVLVASVEGGGNAVTKLQFKVHGDTNNVWEIDGAVTRLTASLVAEKKLQVPITYDNQQLDQVLFPYSPNQDQATPNTALSELMSDVDGRDYVMADGYFGYDPATVGCRTATCPMGLLASKALLSVCHDNHMRTPGSRDCDIAFLNAGAIRGSFFQSDHIIDLKSLLKVFPFHNKVVSLDMTGATIEKILAHGVRSGRSGRFVQSNLRWVYYPYPKEPVGISIEDAQSRVMDIGVPTPEGYTTLMKNQTYRVITLNYLLAGNDGFDSVFDSTFEPKNVINHSDSVLTALMSHLRRNRFTWEISRDDLNSCLFNQTLPLVEPTCVMAFSNVTRNEYRSCLSDINWCSIQSSNYQKAKVIYDDEEADKKKKESMEILLGNDNENDAEAGDQSPSQSPHKSTFSLFLHMVSDYLDSFTTTPTWIANQSPQVSLYGSTHNHHLYSHFETHAVAKQRDVVHKSQIYSDFYSLIPRSDRVGMDASALGLDNHNHGSDVFYTTPSTGWAKGLFENGDLYMPVLSSSSSQSSSSEQSSSLTTLQAPSAPNIVLVNDIPYDPELPPISGPTCGVCSGYGICRDDQQCECSLMSQTSGDSSRGINHIILDNGAPRRGLYRGLKMISGSSCSSVLQRAQQSNGSVIGITFLAFFAILLSLVSLLIIILFKNNQIIKSAGPDMLIVMCCGALLVSVGLVFGIYDPFSDSQRHFLKLLMKYPEPGWGISGTLKLRILLSATAVCNLQFWLILIGFIVMFGAILAKSYRIHRIFNAKTLNEIREFTNFRTNLFFCIAIAIQLTLLLLILLLSPMRPQSHVYNEGKSQTPTHYWVNCSVPSLNNSDEDGDGTTISRLDSRVVIYIVLAVYNFSILAVGMYLSIATRNVDKRFNESNILAFSVYNIVFSAIIFFITMSSVQSPRGKIAQSAILAYGVVSTLLIMLGWKFKEIYQAYQSQKANEDGDDEMAAPRPDARLLSFDPILLRTQALEREFNLSSTISTQQEQISTLIQHILSQPGDESTSHDQFLSTFEESHHRQATTPEGFQRENSVTNSNSGKGIVTASSSNLSSGTMTTTTTTTTVSKPRFKPDVQQIIDQYRGLELGSVVSSTLSSRETAQSVAPPSNGRYCGPTGTNDSDKVESRRSRLKSTFRKSSHWKPQHGTTTTTKQRLLDANENNTTMQSAPTEMTSSSSSQYDNDSNPPSSSSMSQNSTTDGLLSQSEQLPSSPLTAAVVNNATGTFGTIPGSGLTALSGVFHHHHQQLNSPSPRAEQQHQSVYLTNGTNLDDLGPGEQ